MMGVSVAATSKKGGVASAKGGDGRGVAPLSGVARFIYPPMGEETEPDLTRAGGK